MQPRLPVCRARATRGARKPVLSLQTQMSEQIIAGLRFLSRRARPNGRADVLRIPWLALRAGAARNKSVSGRRGRSPVSSPEKLAARRKLAASYAGEAADRPLQRSPDSGVLYVVAAEQTPTSACAFALNLARQGLDTSVARPVQGTVRNQYFVLQLDPERALRGARQPEYPELKARKELLDQVRAIVSVGAP